MANNELLSRLGVEHPIVLAPMGGGPSTPELVAAVCNAGGLGSLAAPYLTPEQILHDIRRVRELTNKPFAVNLFAGGWERHPQADAESMLAILSEIHHQLGLPAPTCQSFLPIHFRRNSRPSSRPGPPPSASPSVSPTPIPSRN